MPLGETLSFIGDQTFVVDPRNQGMGLSSHEFLDGYANKFFILSGKQSTFISPREIPDALTDYFDSLGIDTATKNKTFALPPDAAGRPLTERLTTIPEITRTMEDGRGSIVIPYMVTPEVEAFAKNFGCWTFVDAATSNELADKEIFQRRLAEISDEIAQETGLDIAIPARSFIAGDRFQAGAAYKELSENGRKNVVLIRPKSASALGIFVVDVSRGINGVSQILNEHFSEDDRVLLETYIDHDYSPSMQGSRLAGGPYSHLYFGRQHISIKEGRVDYDASQIPFGNTEHITKRDLGRMRAVHEALGETLITHENIAGIAGFDAVIGIGAEGALRTLKISELNLHLPGSVAVYAALHKVFPEGFEDVAYNCNIPLKAGETFADFMKRNADYLVRRKGQYGLFPLNASFPDKVDVILFAKNEEQLHKLRGLL